MAKKKELTSAEELQELALCAWFVRIRCDVCGYQMCVSRGMIDKSGPMLCPMPGETSKYCPGTFKEA